MEKSWSTEFTQASFTEFRSYQTHRFAWETNATKMEQAAYARQFSKNEEAMLLAFRQAPLPISISTAILEAANAAMTSANPTVAVSPIKYPFDPVKSDESLAVSLLYNAALKDDWYSSLGSLQFDRGVVDVNNVGHGFLYVIPRFEHGRFRTTIEHLPWQYVFIDPAVTQPLYNDADNIIYAMPMSTKNGYRMVKGMEPGLSMEEYKDQFVKSGSVYRFNGVDNSYGPGKRGGDSEEILFMVRSTIEEEATIKLVLGEKAGEGVKRQLGEYREVTPEDYTGSEYETLVKQGILKRIDERQFKLCQYISVGELTMKKVLPIDTYNTIPMIYDSPGTPYPYGRMWYIYPMQRALNKLVMNIMLNSSILNNIKVIAEDNQIINETQWTTTGSIPGAILKWRNTMPGVSKPPTIVQPSPLSDGFLALPGFIIKMMEYVSGIPSLMQGDGAGAPNVYSTVSLLNSAASQKVKRRMRNLGSSLSVVGKVMAKFYETYAPLNGFTERTSSDGKDKETLIYNEVELTQDGETKKFKVNIKPGTDLSEGVDDVRFTVEGSMGSEAATEANMLANVIQTTGKEYLLPELLKRMNIADLPELLQKVESEEDLTSQMKQMQEYTQKMEKQNNIYENQLKQMEVTLAGAKAKGQLDKGVTKILTELETSVKSMQGES